MSEEERNAIVKYHADKALSSIEEIHKVMPLMVWNMIANHIYYALYNATIALLTSDNHKVSSAQGAIALFHKYYVRTGQLTKEDGHLFGQVFAFRQGSDYDDFIDATGDDVKHLLPLTEKLIEKILSLIK